MTESPHVAVRSHIPCMRNTLHKKVGIQRASRQPDGYMLTHFPPGQHVLGRDNATCSLLLENLCSS